MYGIAICGGGGKSWLASKYPKYFIDIDTYVWSDKNKQYHNNILDAVKNNDQDKLSVIYKTILTQGNNYFKNLKKIVLFHHPVNAQWLDLELIGSFKPSYDLFLENINNRSTDLQLISINSWKNLDTAHEYKTHQEFENLMLNLVKTYFH